MATAPQIALRDGTGYTQELILSTNLEALSLTGTIDINTVDVQVSVNGGAFISDSTLVFLNGLNFEVPNPSSLPDGLPLALGQNTIALRSIDIVGGVSAASVARITRVSQAGNLDLLIPTGVRVRRSRDAVNILAEKPDLSTLTGPIDNPQNFEFRGFNFYASAVPAGTTGYFKINDQPVTVESTEFEEDVQELPTASYNAVFASLENNLRIRITQEDEFGAEIGQVIDSTIGVISYGGDLKFTGQFEARALTEFITFQHVRGTGLNADQFLDVDVTSPLYYVVTGIYFDPLQGSEFESPYSQEVLGTPLTVDTAIRDLPGKTQIQVVLDYVAAIQRVNREISLVPGSTTRDVAIDPFSSEIERVWFIVDFVHRSSSFLTLLAIDDADGDGASDPVSGSAYKTALRAALGLRSDTAVQTLIDTQFDKLAANFQRTRLPGRPSVGQVVFFTTTRPATDITIPSGTIVSTNVDTENGLPAVRFLSGGTFVLPAAQADAFYNFTTRRYEITVDVVAESPGSNGNRPAGPSGIVNIGSSVSGGLSVVQNERTVFGTDVESNADLAARAMLGFVSVDTGTEGGYAATAAKQIGVIKTKIVKSGDPLMMRDFDEIRMKHIGGKVDVWIQGLRERTVTENFSFTFEIARDVRCQIIDAVNLIFRVLDSRVTPTTPIIEILNNPIQSLGVRNATVGADYDLTGVTLIDYQTFQVNNLIPQPATALDDIVTADYRFRSVNQFRFTLQPVRRVVSVVGEASGALNITTGFTLFKTDDPLLDGESTIANDYLVINQILGVPSGAIITVNDEQHVLIGFFEEPLLSIGINTATIRVFNEARTIEYLGPSSPTPDFDILSGTATTPSKIVRTNPSTIVSGQTVSVDYDHDENFTVTYVINDLLQQMQRSLDTQRHVTADVLAKQAIQNEVDIETTVQLKNGAARAKVDPATRDAVSLELNQHLIGQGTAQSDIINAVDSTPGVDFQVIPLARMGYADGSRRVREAITNTNQRVPSLDIGGNRVYVLSSALEYPTTDGGGLQTEHRGVFQDDVAMGLSATLANVGLVHRQAYIVGADGAVIAGYSDDATLIVEGFITATDIAKERLRRTANRVFLSLSASGIPPDNPTDHQYRASYIVRNDIGPHDIEAQQVEFLELGNLTLTLRS
jgi:uncharacterized phage protein gp47/JayE